MAEETQLHVIDGTVQSVIFQNEENGYTVLRLSAGDGTITVVGCMPGVAPGESVSVAGTWTHHASFGEQFKAEQFERRMPSGENAMFDYLACGAIKGVGAMTARRIMDAFGEDAFRVIEEEPERLSEIRGITAKKAREIGESFRQKNGMRVLVEFLSVNGLPVNIAMALWRRYGDLALNMIRSNPYLLVDEDFQVAFSLADQLAAAMGLEEDDPRRLEAGLLFEMRHNLGNGHTFLPRRKLIPATGQLLDCADEPLEEAMDALCRRGEVVCETIAGEEACYLSSLYDAETHVAQRVEEMSRAELLPPPDLDRLIDRVEQEQGITYAAQQREAVALAASRQIMLLTGGPGTGKTTSLRGILGLFQQLGLETALAAPTGRAAKRLGELCGEEASTIHRLLETGFDEATGQLAFQRDEDEPLKADAVIVDETSMVDITLMSALLSALRSDCRLVLVGDPDQLPSVGPGNLFADLIRSGKVPTVRLTEIFRQAQQSAIVMSAHGVNEGIVPELRNTTKDRDFFFIRRKDGQAAVDTIVELCQTRLPKNMGIPPAQIQVLSPTRKYTTGTANLNQALQAALNPLSEKKNQRSHGSVVFREGDRVMQVKNNYEIMWRQKNSIQSGMGMFNGDIGVVEEVDPKDGTVKVNFDDRMVEYTSDMLGELELAYAMTVHKSQGSEYRAVVLAALDGAPMLLSRGVLYTAITRARELLVIVGDDAVVAKMVANDRQTRRYSGLRARLVAGTF